MKLVVGGGVLVCAVLLCAGTLPSPRDDMPTRLQMARQVAQHPFVKGAPEFLTSYDPERFGERVQSQPWTRGASSRKMHPVALDGEFSFGNQRIESMTLGFGYLDEGEDRLLKDPLSTEHVLKSMTVVFGPAACPELRSWLDETYGVGPRPGNYDGITHAIKFAWHSGGGGPRSCQVYWSYWMPDDKSVWAFYDTRNRLPEGSAHQTAEPYRLAYNRAWLRTAQRVLRGESLADVEAAILKADLDAAHRAELRKRLAELVDEAP